VTIAAANVAQMGTSYLPPISSGFASIWRAERDYL